MGFGWGLWGSCRSDWCCFYHSDLPCYVSVEELKSLMRLPDIIACAKQNITTAEISARKGTGLAGVLRWLQGTHRASC